MYSDSCEYRGNAFAGNAPGVAVMYSRSVTMMRQPVRGQPGAGRLRAAAQGDQGQPDRGQRAGAEHRRAVRRGRGPDRRSSATSSCGNGWAIRLMADATDNAFVDNRFEGNTFDVATNSQASSPSTFAENYWDCVRRLRPRPRRHRRRALPSGAPVLGARRAERAAPDPAAQLPARPAGCRRAGRFRCITPETLVDARPLMRWTTVMTDRSPW